MTDTTNTPAYVITNERDPENEGYDLVWRGGDHYVDAVGITLLPPLESIDPQFGAMPALLDEVGDANSIFIPWHNVRRAVT